MPRRRSNTEAFSLFAFQDIITSVTGVIILITLILALELMDRVENSPAEQTKIVVELLDDSIDDLKARKLELQTQISELTFDSADLPTTDIDALKRHKAGLSQRVNSLKADVRSLESQELRQNKELDKLQKSSAVEANQSRLKKATAETMIAEQRLKKLESSDQMFFRSGTTGKTIWLVEVTDNGFLVAKLGEQTKPKRYGTTYKFGSWWKGLASAEDALYVLTKPSGVASEYFEAAREQLLKGKISFGYTVIQESAEIIDPMNGAGGP